MEQQWHDIFLHNDTGDAAFHKGAPLLLEALQVISDVQSISAATRLGLHLRDAEHGSALDRLGSTFTDKHVNQEHAAHAAAAAPLLQGFADLFRECVAPAAPSAAPASVVTVAELDGLLLPASAAAAATSSAAAVAPELRAHPMFSYAAFRRQLDRLSALMSSGEVFSACEPRVKVLQSRFRLYRAYNGGREDEFHPTFGGGDIKRAPKCDLRRIETCVSAGSVVRFLEELLRDRPDYPLCAEDVAPEEEAAATTTTDGAAASTATTTSRLSVAEAVRRFFGSTVATSERVLTEEGLCLRPSYAADSADRWLSLQQLADSGGSPRAVNASRLLQHLLSTSGGADGEGELLALLLRPILTRVLHSGTSYDRLELELTVSGADATELPRLARWCARSGLLETCPGVFFRLHIAQDAYADAAPHTTASRFFGDVLHNVFSPIWQAHLAEAAEAAAAAAAGAAAAAAPAPSHEAAAVRALLRRTTGFAVTLNHAAAVQEMPATGDPSRQFPLPRPSPPGSSAATTPPDAFFVYHVWRNVQLLNAFLLTSATSASAAAAAAAAAATTTTEAATSARGARSAYTFTLHGGANSRTLFGESVLGLLLADVVVNPAAAFEWSPLTYLYTLTQRHVLLTPSRNRCSSASVQQTLSTTAMPLAVQVGMHVSVATLDPLFYDTTNDALSEELMELTKQRGLANADVTEMCLRSLESSAGCLSWAERRHLLGYAWPHAQARYNQFPATQVSSLRLHHRACALEHELDIVLTAARHGGGGGDSGGGGVPTCTAADEAHLRAALFLPPAADDGAGSSVTAPRRTTCASTRALQRERDPLLLQSLSGYHAHEAQMEYPRILISGPDTAGPSAAAKRLMAAMATREAYQRFVCHQPPEGRSADTPAAATTVTAWRNGVLDVEEPPQQQQRHRHVDSGAAALPTWSQFQRDVQTLRRLASADPTVAKYASKRLDMLESKYKLHVALTNDDEETYTITTSATASGRRRVVQPIRGDAHNCVKVDVHCHMASGMTAKSLLLFMQKKVNDHPDDVVGVNAATGAPITLVDFFYDVLGEQQQQQQQQQQQSGSRAARVAQRLGEMPIAALQVHAGNATFHRFDRFNHRFSPMGITALRSLFLKTDNLMRGRYFAELIRGAFAQSEQEGGTFTENRLSIYGRERHEWDRLSRWFVLHGMSHRTNSWMVQVPRLFHLYQRSGQLRTFHEMLANIFEPLWQASLHPEQHPYLHYFLSHVSGFDSVDNESDREPDQMIDTPPAQWTSSQNPPFAYYMFYMWANITTLNRYRARRGFSTFHFRPHAGESGDPDHMADVFLLADGVGHGINLQKRPVLQYLYYLAQIPLAIVPMSNNVLFCRYKDHPLPSFLYRGLNIAVGTDGALIFHRTEQPLLEEYGTAEALWNLSAADVCELAANSVRTSGFAAARKAAWLGPLYYLRSVAGNDVTRSHVPQTRCAFRYEAYMEEVTYLQSRASQEMACRAMRTPLEEEVDIMDAVGISRAELLERRWSGLPIRGKAPPPPQQQQEPQRICKTHDISHV